MTDKNSRPEAPGHSGPLPRPGVLDVPYYFQGASTIPGVDNPIKLSSNENPFGASPAALEALRASVGDAHRYPEGNAEALGDALSELHGLDRGRLLTGGGSDDLIALLFRCFVAPGDKVAMFTDSFRKFYNYTIGGGAEAIQIARDADQDFAVELDDILAELPEGLKLFCIANPDNPTGTALDANFITELHAALPSDTILLLDGAYGEFLAGFEGYSQGYELASRADNVILFKTFSKAYGLAGTRIGWCYGGEKIVGAMAHLRQSFPISVHGIAAALAAVGDQSHVEKTVAHTQRHIAEGSRSLKDMGFAIPPAFGNFLMMRFPNSAPISCDQCNEGLLQRGVIARPITLEDGEKTLRVTIGTDKEMAAFYDALGQLIKL